MIINYKNVMKTMKNNNIFDIIFLLGIFFMKSKKNLIIEERLCMKDKSITTDFESEGLIGVYGIRIDRD